MRTQFIPAVADERHAVKGVAVVGSYQMSPQTTKPYHVRAVSFTDKTERNIDVRLTQDEAQKLVQDWISMGLFGRHGRVETSAAA